MKILYLINSTEFTYHKIMAEAFMTVTSGDIIDVGQMEDPGEGYRKIKAEQPDVIIAFDLAGHAFRTGMGELSLNALYCRMANILFQKTGRYGQEIKKRENLSMFMYISPNDDINEVRSSLLEVPNIDYLPVIMYKQSDEQAKEENHASIVKWWSGFKTDAMII